MLAVHGAAVERAAVRRLPLVRVDLEATTTKSTLLLGSPALGFMLPLARDCTRPSPRA